VTTVLEEIGVDVTKLQEIPLPSDPEEQALERARVEGLRQTVQRWLDLRAHQSRFYPVLVRCDWDGAAIPQTQIRGRLVRGVIGVLCCQTHAQEKPEAWLAHFKEQAKR
jgi:hypothetical protein